MQHVIEMADVSVHRGGTTLLNSITWEVEASQRWVIVGANGAGKSTLLQVAAARLHPTSGVVGVLGEVLGATNVRELRPRIGLASATTADHVPGDELAGDVVMTAAHGVVGRGGEKYDSTDGQRALELLTAMGVSHLVDRTYATLSEGERQRVLIARALMTDPEILLLDEPAAGLDIAGREDVVHRLHGLAAEPYAPTLVVVTHHVEDIPPGFTHALVLRAGSVVAAGPLSSTLTGEVLTEAFAMPITVEERAGRWTARAELNPSSHGK